MTRDLVIIGCGGFGREVADVVNAINAMAVPERAWNLLGFLDDNPSSVDRDRVERLGLKVLGRVPECASELTGISYVVGIGNGYARQKLSNFADAAGLVPATLIHPRANIGADTIIGAGSILCSGVEVTTNVSIGRHVNIDRNSAVGHDTILDDFSTINPLVAISGNCYVGVNANLGTHSAILPGVRVGDGSVVGAAACVTRDVPSLVVVKGVPAH